MQRDEGTNDDWPGVQRADRGGRVRVRIGDVAAAAGTSIATVSNYLNGRPHRMGQETVARIEQSIDRLGYRPSWAARQLKTGFAPVLGLLVPSVANPFHGALARHVEEAALERGFQVVFGGSLRDPKRELRYAEDFWSFGIRGIIIGSSPLSLDHLAELIRRGLRVVVFDRSATRANHSQVDSVSMDNGAAGYIATRHLLELGHSRIGYVSGPTPTASRRDRFAGYCRALSEFGIAVDAALTPRVPASSGYDDTDAAELGRKIALRLLTTQRDLTALVALNDMYAFGACAAVRELGLSVPKDVSVVGIDDIVLAGMFDPPLTTVHHPIDALSLAAVERLISLIQGKADDAPRHLVLAPELVVRRSTGSPRTRRSRRLA
ncbi:MAG TPA: LacI family DNA-binding transcriptional regulator [Roseiarcus sp.]|jgi:DNA-binding LacI/PurR family transcriptional regulator|nr:LacI family DNA-binding transcriptional regulator [Roseiarcus sp.]